MKTLKVPAKINWFLNIVGKRNDGYHLLEMVNQRIALYDELLIEPSDQLVLRVNGKYEAPLGVENIVLRAAKLLRAHYEVKSGAAITLTKQIPMGAGLGGGSADAASALKALVELWGIETDMKALSKLGLQLGADVPYCLFDKPAVVKGVGEIVQTLPHFPTYWLLLAKPEQALSTQEVFRRYASSRTTSHGSNKMDISKTLHALQSGQIYLLNQHCGNSLQHPAACMLPQINTLLDMLYQQGAQFAQMSGAGSTVFGVFTNENNANRALDTLKHHAPFSMVVPTI